MALASRSCSSLPLQLLRYAPSHLDLGALYHRRPPSARLQLSAAASSYKEAAGNDGTIAAAATRAPVAVDAAAAADEKLAKARRGALPGYPEEGRPSQPKEGNRRDIMSNPSPPGPPAEGSGGNGGGHH
jgi:hypothetical protein